MSLKLSIYIIKLNYEERKWRNIKKVFSCPKDSWEN